jgi:hypothetical protein
MNRLQQDAADSLAAYERQQRHKQGYGPRPVEPIGRTWAPTLTEQQKQEQQKYIEDHKLPF